MVLSVVLELELGLITCKANTLASILSLWPFLAPFLTLASYALKISFTPPLEALLIWEPAIPLSPTLKPEACPKGVVKSSTAHAHSRPH